MARGPSNFKQRDVTRALRAAMAAGIEVGRIEIDQAGKISVVIGQSNATDPAPTAAASGTKNGSYQRAPEARLSPRVHQR
jgi:hypothetical protein